MAHTGLQYVLLIRALTEQSITNTPGTVYISDPFASATQQRGACIDRPPASQFGGVMRDFDQNLYWRLVLLRMGRSSTLSHQCNQSTPSWSPSLAF